MDIRRFNPYVRFCASTRLTSNYPEALKAYDFRLFYVIDGGFTAYFEKEEITVEKGGVLIFPPDTEYRIAVDKFGYSNHIIVNFDLVSDVYGGTANAPVSPGAFCKDKVFSRSTLPPFDRNLHIKDADFCMGELKEMCSEKSTQKPYCAEMLSATMKKLLVELMRKHEAAAGRGGVKENLICRRVKEYVEKNLRSDITNLSVAKSLGYHPYYCNSVFKKHTGTTLHTYIISKKLELAKEYLLVTDMSVSEIGERCGFSNAAYFTECFSKNVGVTPSGYRKKAR